MIVLSYNLKGGCGKTTLVVGAAARAAERGMSLTVIDADRQKNTSRHLAHMAELDFDGQSFDYGTVRVTSDLGETESYGLTLIDAPPAFTALLEIPHVDVLLIPCDGIWATDGSVEVIQEARRHRPDARIVLWYNKAYTSKLAQEELNEFSREMDGVELYRYPIGSHEAFKKAEAMGCPVWKVPYSRRSLAVQNYELLCDWVVDGCIDTQTYEAGADREDFSRAHTRRIGRRRYA